LEALSYIGWAALWIKPTSAYPLGEGEHSIQDDSTSEEHCRCTPLRVAASLRRSRGMHSGSSSSFNLNRSLPNWIRKSGPSNKTIHSTVSIATFLDLYLDWDFQQILNIISEY
jgi:hypothetical protein